MLCLAGDPEEKYREPAQFDDPDPDYDLELSGKPRSLITFILSILNYVFCLQP